MKIVSKMQPQYNFLADGRNCRDEGATFLRAGRKTQEMAVPKKLILNAKREKKKKKKGNIRKTSQFLL